MSTKIYTGFKIDGDLNFTLKMLMRMREDMLKIVTKKGNQLFTSNLVTRCDFYVAGLSDEKPKSVNFNYWCEVMKRQKEMDTTSQRDPEIDFDFKVSLFPVKHDMTIGIYYTEQSELEDLFIGKDYITEYGYWNNIDKPDDISDKEWKKRSKLWDKVLPGIGIPSLCGYSFDIISNKHHFPSFVRASHMAEYIPSLELRAEYVAKEIVFRKFFKFSDVSNKDIFKVLRKHRLYIKTRHGKRAIEYYKNLMLPRLYSPEKLLECI